MLLPSLPRKHRFRVIFVNRDISEIGASQQKLRHRLAGRAFVDVDTMGERLQHHRERMLELLREAENVELLKIDYARLLDSPNELLARIAQFAKIDPGRIDKMANVIDPKLRHFNAATAHAD